MLLFRSMKESFDGLPEIGPSTRTLGVRPGIDVSARDPDDVVRPGQDGMSVSPDDPGYLPYFRRPPEFGGTGKDPIWSVRENDLGSELRFRPDPANPGTHGFIEPSFPTTLKNYQDALAKSRVHWKKL